MRFWKGKHLALEENKGYEIIEAKMDVNILQSKSFIYNSVNFAEINLQKEDPNKEAAIPMNLW